METWEEYVKRRPWLQRRPINWTPAEWEAWLARERREFEEAQRRAAQPIKIKLTPSRTKETYWTRYRTKVLAELGFSDYEIAELKYNRLSLPRVRFLLKDVKAEVRRIQKKYGLKSYRQAAAFRREHFVELIDLGDIVEYDPYIRMGYM
ncbi:MAG: hypothetical protein QW212_00630 [Nitrososphaerales archaeon]